MCLALDDSLWHLDSVKVTHMAGLLFMLIIAWIFGTSAYYGVEFLGLSVFDQQWYMAIHNIGALILIRVTVFVLYKVIVSEYHGDIRTSGGT